MRVNTELVGGPHDRQFFIKIADEVIEKLLEGLPDD